MHLGIAGGNAVSTTVTEDEWHADVFRQGNAYLVVVNFGYNPEAKTTFSVMIGLEPLPGGDMELFFTVIANGANNEKKEYHSGADTVGLFPKEARRLVLKIVLSATKSLINTAQSKNVRFFTFDADPPEKALVKYGMIAIMCLKRAGMQLINPIPTTGDIRGGGNVARLASLTTSRRMTWTAMLRLSF